MSNQHIDELTYGSIKRFTRYLSLPARFNIANPPDEWFRDQEARQRDLPPVWLRPAIDSLNVVNFIQRGLMKISEKQSLPFVPESAILCRSHRGLNPWRVRSLFVLVASEVMGKLERMRRVARTNSDLAQDSSFRDFVWRMTSVQALWMERAAYERLYGHPPLRMQRVRSQCEACICAVVGGDTRLLVDFKAHLHSRARKFQPVLLRVVELWIDAFDGQAEALHAESAVLGEKLRRIRTEVGLRRHHRRQRRREAGKSVPYSKARHDDASRAAAAEARSSTARDSSAASNAYSSGYGGFHSRSAHHVPDASYTLPSHSTRLPGDNPDDPLVDPFADGYWSGDDGDDENADDRAGNYQDWEHTLGFYHQQARRDGREFDTASVNSAFHAAPNPAARPADSSRSGRDNSRSTQTTPPHDAHRALPTTTTSDRDASVRDHHSARDAVGTSRPARRPSHSRTSRPTRDLGESTNRTDRSSRAAMPPQSSSSSVYSIPASMAQRQSQALSALEQLAISTAGGSRPSHASSHDRTASAANRPPANSRRLSTSSYHRTSGDNPPAAGSATNHRHDDPFADPRDSDTVSPHPLRPVSNRPVTQDLPAPDESLSPAPLNISRKDPATTRFADAADRLSRLLTQPPPRSRRVSSSSAADDTGRGRRRRPASQAPPPSSSRRLGSRAPSSRRPSVAYSAVAPSPFAPSTVAPSTVAAADVPVQNDVWSSVRNSLRNGSRAGSDAY